MHKFLIENRPLFMQQRNPGGDPSNYFYTHDGNKNVSEAVFYQRARGVAAHYEYAPFGEVTMQTRGNAWGSLDLSMHNPWRFSSEYADDASATVYYNYRHYEPMMGRWMSRDPMEEVGGLCLYGFCDNAMTFLIDTLGKTKYWSNYLNNATTPSSPDVWEKVGGRLFWSFLTIEGYWNSCAIRVSRTLILSGHSISAKAGREKNYDIKADRTVQRAGKSADKGTMLKAESPNARYVIAARNIGDLLDEVLTDSTIRKDSWNSVEEALRKAECIRQEDGEAFFADNGHAGMIKKGYVDPYFPQKSKGRIWRIK